MTFGFTVHQIGAKRVRVLFDAHVTSSALVVGAYSLSAIPPPTALIESVEFFDETHRSVVLNCFTSLTTGSLFSLQIAGVVDILGNTVSGAARNFTANVHDPPRVLGAYLSKRGCVDLLFDRPVGQYSTSATASIRDAAGGPGVAMTLVVWATEFVLPSTSLRFALPVGMTAANSYLIDVANVVDISNNVGSGTTEFEPALRSPLPHDYTKITQIQITDAYVADVSSEFLTTATVRVYFNCPVLITNNVFVDWTATQPGPHVVPDTADIITTVDAFDSPSLVTLVNDFKAKLNAHYVASGVHIHDDVVDTILLPDAFDTNSAIDLLNEIQPKLKAHYLATSVHVYTDTVNTFLFLNVPHGQLAFAIAVINEVKGHYNGHLSPTFIVNFSSVYLGTTLGYVLDFTSLLASRAFPAESPYTYFVDLHLLCNSNILPITITAAMTSEDGGSTTNIADYTGSIVARAGNSPGSIVAKQILIDDSVSISADREIIIDNPDFVTLVRPDGTLLETAPARLTATLPSVLWALDQLMVSYTRHISFFTSDNAGHLSTDTTNLIGFSDYAITPTLASVITVANNFRATLNSHMSSVVFHFHAEYGLVTSPPAFDMDSLVALVADIRDKFLAHNIRIGPHVIPGWRIFAARLFDKVVVETKGMMDGESYTFRASLRDSYHDNVIGEFTPGGVDRRLGTFFYHPLPVALPFQGAATHPSLASAIPRPGIVGTDAGVNLESDAVEVYFSKPMRQVPLDATNLFVTGGTIVIKDWSWKDPQTASVRVTSMTPISYSVQAVGLTDEAGNPVYP